MENRIKEMQLALFSDRTSAATISANQLRLYFSGFAYLLLYGCADWDLAEPVMPACAATRCGYGFSRLPAACG